ncbi:transcription initiation factor TFIID subunit 4-like [Dermochelys coriacea]|uniref:transcription initiation factor TFIID subunit 4-like n=1 Tax=Dermochelys coriacea TaxID=27794 RepID=UPI0018E862EF|nr:transcription initiation factor TFIID subunit 4-like [Dermochelys coriacea]
MCRGGGASCTDGPGGWGRRPPGPTRPAGSVAALLRGAGRRRERYYVSAGPAHAPPAGGAGPGAGAGRSGAWSSRGAPGAARGGWCRRETLCPPPPAAAARAQAGHRAAALTEARPPARGGANLAGPVALLHPSSPPPLARLVCPPPAAGKGGGGIPRPLLPPGGSCFAASCAGVTGVQTRLSSAGPEGRMRGALQQHQRLMGHLALQPGANRK